MSRRYPKSRLPGPAVRWFEIEERMLLEAKSREGDKTVRAGYDDVTVTPSGVRYPPE